MRRGLTAWGLFEERWVGLRGAEVSKRSTLPMLEASAQQPKSYHPRMERYLHDLQDRGCRAEPDGRTVGWMSQML